MVFSFDKGGEGVRSGRLDFSFGRVEPTGPFKLVPLPLLITTLALPRLTLEIRRLDSSLVESSGVVPGILCGCASTSTTTIRITRKLVEKKTYLVVKRAIPKYSL